MRYADILLQTPQKSRALGLTIVVDRAVHRVAQVVEVVQVQDLPVKQRAPPRLGLRP